ncbi:MAG TPA: cell division protein FtsL [Gammaproteobacteria bacterium]|nr:cell division protein FtsL [Gammaproteobacteria bacterium]
MNAAAKLLNQGVLSRQGALTFFFTRTHLVLSVFLCMIFMSAFSIIYTINAARDLHASLYQSRDEYSRLYAQQGQLLLERSTLGMQARVERVAEKTFNMIVPEHPTMVMIHE